MSSALNAVGRHHAGADKAGFGGKCNYVYTDGHVELQGIVDTIEKRLWGDKFYSITGNNRVMTGDID